MSKRNRFAKAALCAAAGLMTAGAVAGSASAQPYSYNGVGQYSYEEACKRQRTNRTIVGGLVGAAAGAALGFNMGARGHRNDGAWTGAAVGGLGGGLIGNRTGNCTVGAPPAGPPPRAANDYYGRSYDDDRAYADRSYYGGRGYAPAPYQETVVVEERAPRADSCTLAESPIYLPDGRVQKRFVRVCQDAGGRYQVVD